jgi:hypothetical protein
MYDVKGQLLDIVKLKVKYIYYVSFRSEVRGPRTLSLFNTPGKDSLLLRQRKIFQDIQQAARDSPREEQHTVFMTNDVPIQFETRRKLVRHVTGEESYTTLRYVRVRTRGTTCSNVAIFGNVSNLKLHISVPKTMAQLRRLVWEDISLV